MKMNRKTVLLLLTIVLLAAVSAGTTFSYLNTRTATLDNKLGYESGSIEIIEKFEDWDVKEVQLKNTSDLIPGVVRAMLLPRVEDGDGNYLPCDLAALTAPVGSKIELGDFTFHLADDWASNWFYKDGFFYCRQVLAAGETSPLLLQKVSLTQDTPEMREKYKDAHIKVDVIAHILQAEGGAPQSEWGVVVQGDTVSES